MTMAAPASAVPRRQRRSRPVPRGEAVKVVLALVLNAILFGMVLL